MTSQSPSTVDSETISLAATSEYETVTPKPTLDVEYGVLMDMPFSGGFDAGEIFPTRDVALDDLTRMSNLDGQARAILRILTLPIRAAGFTFVAPEGAAMEEEVQFANDMFFLPPQSGGMTVCAGKFMRYVLKALLLGFSPFELVYHVPDEGPLAGKIVLRKAAYREPDSVRFLVDDHGGFEGFRQVASFQGKSIDVRIEIPYAWYWAANEEENPFYGNSYFLPAYYHWDKKRKLYYLMHLAAQFAAVPGRFGTWPTGASPTEIANFRRALMNFGLNTAIAAPSDYTLEEMTSSGEFPWMQMIDHHNSMMSKSVLAQFIDLGQQEGKGSSYALSEDQSDLFILGLQGIMAEIEEQVSYYLLPRFIDWNFGSGNYPRMKFGPLTDSTKDVIRDIFKIVAAAATVNVTPQFLLETERKMADRLGFDIDYDQLEEDMQEKYELEQKNEIDMLKDPAPTPGEAADQNAEQFKQGLAVKQPPPGAPKPGGGPAKPPPNKGS